MRTDLQPLLSAGGMRAADHATIEDWGVPGRVLMETASRAAVAAIEQRYAVEGARVTVLAGPGNNGGDALVVARVLAARGAVVRCLTLDPEADRGDDRGANLSLLHRLGDASDRLDAVAFEGVRQVEGAPADLVVDGLLGIGARGPLRPPFDALGAWMNRQHAPVVALDIPSGLDATTGRAADGTPEADLTVTFGALKTGLLLGDGPRVAGDVVVVEIGIPEAVVRAHASAWHASAAWAAERLPRRAADAHKYSAGRALCVVGSRAYTGAAVLATRAAYRAGAGAVVACVPASVQATLDAAAPEVMVDAQPETEGGHLAKVARGPIRTRAEAADAVLLGCGLGRDAETARLVQAVVREIEAPLVLDADGLGAFAEAPDALADHPPPLVLTPHLGELRRLLGDPAFDPDDRVEAARALAARWDAVLVVKGMPSMVGLPDGRVMVGPPGEPALATAGTGDVLAGTIAGLLAQGVPAPEAAACALHLGAAAARLWAEAHGPSGLVASDLVDLLPRAARSLR
ncbi:MAG: NAD(P)H-hydrate dehydratase [Bacteroidota bacterium]